MNKLLGLLNTILLAPDPGTAAEGDIYGGGGAVAPVKEVPGAGAPGADDGAADGGEAAGGEEGGENFGDGAEEGGEEGAGDGAEGGEEGGDETSPEAVAAAAAAAGKAPAPIGTVKLDAETIAEIRRSQQPTPIADKGGEGQPQLTKEEITKLLNPVVVTPDVLKTMGFVDATPEQVVGFQNFSNAIVKNAVSVARLIVEREKEAFEKALGPLFQEREVQKMEAARADFYKGFGHLQKYDKVVRLAAREVSHLNADGSEKTQAQIYKDVAAKTTATLLELGVNVKITPANLSAGGKTIVPKPNGAPAPGRSGGGQTQSSNKNNPDADIYSR